MCIKGLSDRCCDETPIFARLDLLGETPVFDYRGRSSRVVLCDGEMSGVDDRGVIGKERLGMREIAGVRRVAPFSAGGTRPAAIDWVHHRTAVSASGRHLAFAHAQQDIANSPTFRPHL